MRWTSFLVNALIFFVIFNFSYFQQKWANPNYPNKPLKKMLYFPLTLALLFSLIINAFKGFFLYQLVLFILALLFAYWLFNISERS